MGLETRGIIKYKNENTLKMPYTKPSFFTSHQPLQLHELYLVLISFQFFFPTCLKLQGGAFPIPFCLLASPLLQVLNIKQNITTSKVWRM
jgi:hypothetical protein